MKRGYIRLSKTGPTLAEQQALLRQAGIDDFADSGPVYIDYPPAGRPKAGVDQLPKRALAIASLRAGDELVIAGPGRLGTSSADTLQALQEIAGRGAAVFDARVCRAYPWEPAALDLVAFIEQGASDRAHEGTAKMRAKRAELGIDAGPPPALVGEKRQRAEELWADPKIPVARIVEETGVSASTLYRHLPPRGIMPTKQKRRK